MRLLAFAFVAALSCSLSFQARAADPHPWESAQTVLDAVNVDFSAKGIMGVASHVDDLEHALAGAKDAVLATRQASGTVFLLTDHDTDLFKSVIAATALAGKNGGGQVVSVANPYPMISLYLGSYYNEVGKFEDAARVLDAGLAIYEMDGYISPTGEHRSWLMLERASSSNGEKRFDETLAIIDRGLVLPVVSDQIRAHFLRNRGFALTELGRLDDAEQAYNDSLKLDPSSDTARNELRYIARLRASGQKETGGLKPLAKPATGP